MHLKNAAGRGIDVGRTSELIYNETLLASSSAVGSHIGIAVPLPAAFFRCIVKSVQPPCSDLAPAALALGEGVQVFL